MPTADNSPTARALQALELLQRVPGTTAQALADRLGVTERAARRYIAVLREAGIPVESTRGRYGGYRIGRGRRPPPLVFTAAEALGLVMAVLDGQHAAADPTDPVGAALGKLIDALPQRVGRPAATMRANALAVPNRAGARPDPDVTAELVTAVADRRQVRLRYRTASGSAHPVLVDPWSVVVRYGRWYLLCHSHRAGAVRTLRVDRIHDVDVLADTFTPPDDLDPVALLEHHLGAGWTHPVRVTFHASYADVGPFVHAPAGVLTPTDDGSGCVLTGSTDNPSAYVAERLSHIPYPFTIDEGPELRTAARDLATRLARGGGAGDQAGWALGPMSSSCS